MLKNADPSIFITIFIAGIIIIVGIALFTTYFKWDEYEKKYLELLNKNFSNKITVSRGRNIRFYFI